MENSGGADGLVLHGLEGDQVGSEGGCEGEEAEQVQGQSEQCHDYDGVYNFLALHGLFGVLPAFEVAVGYEQVLGVHIKIFAYHFYCILHFLCIFLLRPGLGVGGVEQATEVVFELGVGLETEEHHEEVEEGDDGEGEVEEEVED